MADSRLTKRRQASYGGPCDSLNFGKLKVATTRSQVIRQIPLRAHVGSQHQPMFPQERSKANRIDTKMPRLRLIGRSLAKQLVSLQRIPLSNGFLHYIGKDDLRPRKAWRLRDLGPGSQHAPTSIG